MTDLGDNNDSKIIPLCEEERLVNEAKIFALSAIKDWIEKITGKYFLYPKDFRKSLADGILLCNLLNSLKPGSIKRINKISTPISGYDISLAIDNLSKFLQCCEDDFGLSSQVLFKISDLEDLSEKFPDSQLDSEKRIERVLLCLFHLAKSVEDQFTQVTLDNRPFTSLLKGRDIREMRKIKSHSMSEDSVFETSVPEMIHRQTPNYLANKAHETLEQTKQNQNILHKTIENDDWQESLQNWREKRRQVLSSSVADQLNTDFDTYDSSELVKLKEKARKMKQLRDQIKDQNLQSNHDLTDSQENASIPHIDDETKAMIERLKQKKLDEEIKRQFSVSSPNTMSFASDSDLSNSLSMNKQERNSNSLSKKPDSVPVVPLVSIHNDGDNIGNNHVTTKDYDTTDTIKLGKTRTFTVKLYQRSKQDSEQLWGMDILEKSEMVLVSKVKIGSSADVCEIRKDDEIITINSVHVANQSVDYVKSVFKKVASALSPSEHLTLTLRRSITEDDFDDEDGDEDFISETISEDLDENNEISKDLTAVSTIGIESDDQRKLEKTSSLSFESNLSDNNKPVEIEVSVTPQLFPMRNKSLFSKSQNEKQLNHKNNDSIILDPLFDDDETTLNAISYDEVMSPNKEDNIITSATAKVLGSSQKDEITDPDIMKIDDSQFSFTNSKTDDLTKRRKSNGKSESNIETDQSFSTAPAPTLFNGDQNVDNTLSLGISHSKSENINSLKRETDNSSKNSKKNISKNSAGLGSRPSSSTKEIRAPERKSKTESLKPSKDNKESASRSSSGKRNTYTPTQSQVTFSNVVQDVTHTKSQNKSYSIDKSARNTPVTSTSNDKKKQKSKNRKSSQGEISTKCSSCSQPAGSEDLMVIEELKLHFHLRCFFCSECKIQLGDGKTDTDVRIRRSKLHCATCYDKKSSKSKIRNPFASRQHKSASGSNQSKGGHGDGFSACIKSCDSNNNFSFSPATASLSSPFVINNS